MQSVILLISGVPSEYVNQLQTALCMPVFRVADLRSGLKALKQETFSLVIYSLSDTEVENSGILARSAGLIPVLEIDLTITPTPVLVRRVRSTLTRSAAEQFHARNAAIAHLQGELRDSLTGLLLESQLALGEVDATKHPKLVSVVQSAKKLCARLKLEADLPSPVV